MDDIFHVGFFHVRNTLYESLGRILSYANMVSMEVKIRWQWSIYAIFDAYSGEDEVQEQGDAVSECSLSTIASLCSTVTL